MTLVFIHNRRRGTRCCNLSCYRRTRVHKINQLLLSLPGIGVVHEVGGHLNLVSSSLLLIKVTVILCVHCEGRRIPIVAHWIGVCTDNFFIEGCLDPHLTTERVLRLFRDNCERLMCDGFTILRDCILELIKWESFNRPL